MSINNIDMVKTLFEQGVISQQEYERIVGRIEAPIAGEGIAIKSIMPQFEAFMKNEFSSNTAAGYITNTRHFLDYLFDGDFSKAGNDKVMPAVSAQDIQKWFNSLLSRGYSATSIKRFKHSIKKFFDFLNSEYQFNAPDVDTVDIPVINNEEVELDALRHEEVLAIAEHAQTLRDKAIILVMYEAGMKRQEIVDCKISDVDFATGKVNIYNNGKLDRVGLLSDKTVDFLKEYLKDWEELVEETNEKRRIKGTALLEKSDYLFQTLRTPQISYAVVFKAFKDASFEYYLNRAVSDEGLAEDEAKKYAGEQTEKVNTETLRRSRRAYYFALGKSVDTVQALMGDSNYHLSKRYLKVAQKLYPEAF